YNGAGSTVLASFVYNWDAGDRLTSEVDNGVTTPYTYLVDNELFGDGTNTYTLDNTGNRTGGATSITNNQPDSDGVWNYSYNAEGNLKKVRTSGSEAWTYGYDNKNELTSATDWNADPDVYGTAT